MKKYDKKLKKSDCLEASVRFRLETVAHRKHLNIIMIVLMIMVMI